MRTLRLQYWPIGVTVFLILMALVILLFGATSCSNTNMAEVIKAASTDPASVRVEGYSPYGRMIYERNNPHSP